MFGAGLTRPCTSPFVCDGTMVSSQMPQKWTITANTYPVAMTLGWISSGLEHLRRRRFPGAKFPQEGGLSLRAAVCSRSGGPLSGQFQVRNSRVTASGRQLPSTKGLRSSSAESRGLPTTPRTRAPLCETPQAVTLR